MNSNMWVGLGLNVPEILIPSPAVNLEKWAVIACDQYTSEPEYWEEIDRNVGSSPSSLRVVLPEVYLESMTPDWIDDKIASINQTMRTYINEGYLKALPTGFILVDRATPFHTSRKGLIASIDLDEYDFTPGNKKKIRATEGTVLSRIPPRVRIRKDATIEVPHVLLLIDDPQHKVIGAAFEQLIQDRTPALYDTSLMQHGGHLSGYFVPEESLCAQIIADGLSALLKNSSDGLLFVVGDGNHSLATAKAHWNNIKATLPESAYATHPARYALVEIENIHDEGIAFEPIHRVVFGSSMATFIDYCQSFWGQDLFSIEKCDAPDSKNIYSNHTTTDMYLYLTDGENYYRATVKNPNHILEVGVLQRLLDYLSESKKDIRVDYIHGFDSVVRLSGPTSVGIFLPPISKDRFFSSLSHIGVYPRKTFSMGESIEKRYYFEAKSIIDSKGV